MTYIGQYAIKPNQTKPNHLASNDLHCHKTKPNQMILNVLIWMCKCKQPYVESMLIFFLRMVASGWSSNVLSWQILFFTASFSSSRDLWIIE